MKEEFFEWIEDGNVVKIDGKYSTQDSLYKNRISTLRELYKYFLKEFIYV